MLLPTAGQDSLWGSGPSVGCRALGLAQTDQVEVRVGLMGL